MDHRAKIGFSTFSVSTSREKPAVHFVKLKWVELNGLSKIPSLLFINSDGKSQIFWLPRAKEESLCGLSQHNMGRGQDLVDQPNS